MSMGGSKRWCFTINNPTPSEIDSFNNYGEISEYLIVAHEIGESGTPHIQGFVHFKNRKTLAGIKKLLPMGRAHLEVARAKGNEPIDYCKKDGIFAEIGTIPAMPHESGGKAMKEKWLDILKASKEGDYKHLEENHPREYIIHNTTIKRMRMNFDNTICAWTKGVWIYGRTGCGK